MSIFNKQLTRRSLLKGAALGVASGAVVAQVPAAFALSHESDSASIHTQTRLALGTFVTLHAMHSSKDVAEHALGRAFERIDALEAELTRHDSAAPLAHLRKHGSLDTGSLDSRDTRDGAASLVHVLQRAARAHSLTQGAFDISVAPLVDLYSAHQNPQGSMRPISAAELAEVRELVSASDVHISNDGRRVRLGRSGMALTLDGIAKGYIVDKASETLLQHGVASHLVNIGGDIRASGVKSAGQPWRIAIENPAAQGAGVGHKALTLPLHASIATSGNYAMFYDAKKQHHHLIDPTRKQSPQHISSVSVLAPTALEADALATAISVLPINASLQLIRSLAGRECCIINAQGRVLTSEKWPVGC